MSRRKRNSSRDVGKVTEPPVMAGSPRRSWRGGLAVFVLVLAVVGVVLGWRMVDGTPAPEKPSARAALPANVTDVSNDSAKPEIKTQEIQPAPKVNAKRTPQPKPRTESELLALEIRRAEAFRSAGKMFDAAKVYAKLVTKNPNDVRLANTLAMLYLHQNRLVEAQAVLKRAMQADPENYLTRVNLAFIAFQAGHISEALKHAEAAVRSAPDEPEAQYAYGVALGIMDQTDEALNAYDAALAKDPTNGRYLQAKCETLNYLWLWEHAVDTCKSAILAEPRNALAHRELGRAYFKLELLNEALSELQTAGRLDPKDRETPHLLGLTTRALTAAESD